MFRYMRREHARNHDRHQDDDNTNGSDASPASGNNDRKSSHPSPEIVPHDECPTRDQLLQQKQQQQKLDNSQSGFVTFECPFPNVDDIKDDELPTWEDVAVSVNSTVLASSASTSAMSLGSPSKTTKRNRTAETADMSAGNSTTYSEDLFPALADETSTIESTAATPSNSGPTSSISGAVAGFPDPASSISSNDRSLSLSSSRSIKTIKEENRILLAAAAASAAPTAVLTSLSPTSSQFKPIKMDDEEDGCSDDGMEVKDSLSSYYKNMLAVKKYLVPPKTQSSSSSSSSMKSNSNDAKNYNFSSSTEYPSDVPFDEELLLYTADDCTTNTMPSHSCFETIYKDSNDVVIDDGSTPSGIVQHSSPSSADRPGSFNTRAIIASTRSSLTTTSAVVNSEYLIPSLPTHEESPCADRDEIMSQGAVGGGESVVQNAGPLYYHHSVSQTRPVSNSAALGAIGIELGVDDDCQIIHGGGGSHAQQEFDDVNVPEIYGDGDGKTKDNDERRQGRYVLLLACLLCLLLTVGAVTVGVGLSQGRQPSNGQSATASSNAVLTGNPTLAPTQRPPENETLVTTLAPTIAPQPTSARTSLPVPEPSLPPTISQMTQTSTPGPSKIPTSEPTPLSTTEPTLLPTTVPTVALTPLPTNEPTTAPSNSPTPLPTVECNEDNISVSQACVEGQNALMVDFTICSPTESDWIGLYSDNAAVANDDGSWTIDENYFDWVWTCGDKQCETWPSSNSFTFPVDNPSFGLLSLRFYLNRFRRGDGRNSDVLAQSQPFVLLNSCG